jgi:GDP-D-mannose 3', 5'-epimerase
MKKNSEVRIDRKINRDDLIVIAGAGGCIAGSLARYFHDLGYTRIRAIDRKPLP